MWMGVRKLFVLLGVAAAFFAAAATSEASSRQFTLFEAPRELLSWDDGLRAQTFDELQGMGVGWVRVVVIWRTVDEHGWTAYDRAISEARARGMNVLVTLSGPVPKSASGNGKSYTYKPSPSKFQRFVTEAGTRWRDQVGIWSIWNEPNHPDFLGPQYSRGKAISPRIYRALFIAGEKGLDASGNGGDTVLMGETAPVGTSHVVPPLTFLRVALCLDSHYHKRRSCGRLGADGYAHHAYTHGTPWYRPRSRNDVTIGVLGRLNRALYLAGRAGAIRPHMPIWLTEFGIQSKPDPFIGVSQIAQAEFRSIAELMAYRNPRVTMFSQYLMRDEIGRAHV